MEMDWFALVVMAGREGAVADGLAGEGCAAYVPEGRRVIGRRHCRASVVVTGAAMPGYVFVRAPLARLAALRRTERDVYGVVGRQSDGEPWPLAESEIDRLRAMQAAGLFDVLPPEPGRRRTTLRIGDRVMVYGGPLEGAEGVVEGVLRRGGRDVVVIPLGRLRAHVDAAVVKGIDRTRAVA
jgi:transcription antitermination factor NusG